MAISFNNLAPQLANLTTCVKSVHFKSIFPLKQVVRVGFQMEGDHHVTVVMKRVLTAKDLQEKVAISDCERLGTDTAKVTINPPNEELSGIVTAYFLSEKIEASMGVPERLFYDKVTVNKKSIIG